LAVFAASLANLAVSAAESLEAFCKADRLFAVAI